MTEDYGILLGNVLDAFDRLFDGHSNAADIQSLLFATAKAMAFSEFDMDFEKAAADILKAIQAGGSREQQNDAARWATDPLRIKVAQAWALAVDWNLSPSNDSDIKKD